MLFRNFAWVQVVAQLLYNDCMQFCEFDLFSEELVCHSFNMMQNLNITYTTFFPLFGVFIKSIHFGSMFKKDFLVFFPCCNLNKFRKWNDRLKMWIMVGTILISIIIFSVTNVDLLLFLTSAKN